MKKVVLTFLISFFAFNIANAYSIGPKNFYKAINKRNLVIVKFWASWCIPCSILNPEFKKAKREMGKKVTFLEYNVDLGGEPLRKYNISVVPTMIIFKNGKEIDRKSEILDSSAIIEWLKEYQ